MPLSERAQESVSTPDTLCATGQPLASPARQPAASLPGQHQVACPSQAT